MGPTTVPGRIAGSSLRDRSELFERQMRPLYEAMVEALAPQPGTRLLHVCCGVGTALEIAARDGATVAGIDPHTELLHGVRGRVPEAELRVGDITELPYDTGSFDQVIALRAVQFVAEPAAAIAELARVVRPGGQVAVGLWLGPHGAGPREFLRDLRERLPSPLDGGVPFLGWDSLEIRDMLAAAGIATDAEDEATCVFEYPDLEAAWQSMSVVPPLVGAIRSVGEDVVREVFVAHHAGLRRPDGSIGQEGRFEYVVGVHG